MGLSTLISGTVQLISGTVHLNKWDCPPFIPGIMTCLCGGSFTLFGLSVSETNLVRECTSAWDQCRSAQRKVATDPFLHMAVYKRPPRVYPFNRNRKYVVPLPVPFISRTVPFISWTVPLISWTVPLLRWTVPLISWTVPLIKVNSPT